MIEIELRFRAGENELEKIEKLGAKLDADYASTDTYFTYGNLKKRKFVLRIREKNEKALLTFKTSSHAKDIAWNEWENQIEDPKMLMNVLSASGFKEVVVIKKKRKQYSYLDYEINLDEIEGLGKFIEIQLMTDKNTSVEVLRDKLADFINQNFGVAKNELIQLGYVKLMLGEK